MRLPRRALAWAYILIGLLAWALTSLHLPQYLQAGFVEGTRQFWVDALVQSNAAGRFLVVDIFFLALAVLTWMLLEARRLQMRGIWLYLAVALFVGISLAVPVFLGMRERALLRADPQKAVLQVSWGDTAIFALLAAMALGAAWLSLQS